MFSARLLRPMLAASLIASLSGCATQKDSAQKDSMPASSQAAFVAKENVELENAYIISRGADRPISGHTTVIARPFGLTLVGLSPKTGEAFAFDAVTGEFLNTFGQLGSGKGQFNNAQLARGIGMQMVVLDSGNDRVQVWSQVQRQFSPINSVPWKIAGQPQQIMTAIIGSEGGQRVWVLNSKEGKQFIDYIDLKLVGTSISSDIDVKAIGQKSVELQQPAASVGAIYYDKPAKTLYVGQGTQILAFDEHVVAKPSDTAIEAGGKVLAISAMECESEYQRGYLIAAVAANGAPQFVVFDRGSKARLGSFRISEVNSVTDVTFNKLASGYFPNGEVTATVNGNAITAVGWDKIADALGIRKRCF